MKSDQELGLQPRWFTGKQWANGLAQRECMREYKEASAATDKTITASSEPDWGGQCEVCGQSPIVPETGMCGPCTFGDSSTVGGNW